MSWTLIAMKFEAPPPPMNRLPHGWEPEVMGTADEVRAKISTHLPRTDWANPAWGLYPGDGFTFEFGLAWDDPTKLTNFAIHVRGGGDAIADLIKFARPNGWYLLDGSTGQWLDLDKPCHDSFRAYQGYVDQIRSTFSDHKKVDS